MRNFILFCLCFFAVGLSLQSQTCVSYEANFDNQALPPDWIDDDTLSNPLFSTLTPNGSGRALFLVGGTGNVSGGMFGYPNNLLPSEVSFYIRVINNDTTRDAAYFALRDSNGYVSGPNTFALTFFYVDFSDDFEAHMSGCFNCFRYQSNRYYHFELKNIDWFSKTYDIFVDGALLASYSFGNFGNINELNSIWVDNQANGTGTYLDELQFRDSPAVTASATSTDVSCFGQADGTISVSASGGNITSYLWSDGSTDVNRNNLPSGSYAVTITNEIGCKDTVLVEIEEPRQLISVPVVENVSCFGDSNGTVSANPSGGTPPFVYQWSVSPLTDSTIIDLSPGPVSLTVTDSEGCMTNVSATVGQPNNPLSTVVNSNDPLCAGDTNGAVSLSPSGGTNPYSVTWSSPLIVGSGSGNLPAGSYQYTLEDSRGCQTFGVIELTDPDPLQIAAIIDQIPCSGDSTGGIMIDDAASGGTGPFSYSWSHGPNGPIVTNLSPGQYTLTMTDANGCRDDELYTINLPQSILTNPSIELASCPNSSNGSIALTPSGGNPPYTYFWNTLSFADSIGGLAPGNYAVIVTDNEGCQFTDTITVDVSGSLIVTPSVTDSDPGQSNGAIDLNVFGSNPFTYQWDNPAMSITEDISNLAPGTYTVIIGYGLGCSETQTFTVGTTTSAPSPSAFEMAIYPNPAQNSVKVAIPALEMGRVEISMVDLRGKIIASYDFGERSGEFLEELDLSRVAKGVYFLRVRQGTKTAVHRLVKE